MSNKIIIFIVMLIFISCNLKDDISNNNIKKDEVLNIGLISNNNDTLFSKVIVEKSQKWILSYNQNEDIYIFKLAKPDKSFDFSPNCTVQKITPSNSLNIKDFVNSYISNLEKQYSENFQILNKQLTQINNFKECSIINFIFNYSNNKMGTIVAFYKLDDSYIILTASGLNNHKDEILTYMRLYDDVIWSFKKID